MTRARLEAGAVRSTRAARLRWLRRAGAYGADSMLQLLKNYSRSFLAPSTPRQTAISPWASCASLTSNPSPDPT